jgi:type IV/VI secretion system ImpK/VasF family protein
MNSILLSDFELLTSEWVQLLKASNINQFSGSEAKPDEALEALSRNLERAIQVKREKASRSLNTRQFELYNAMIYAFCAQVDEEMLSEKIREPLESPDLEDGKSTWLSRLLEQRIFGSRNAGWSLPRSIQVLAARANCDDGELELAKVYLYVLSLGFGATHSKENQGLALVRRELISMLNREETDNFVIGEHNFGNVPHVSEPLQRLAPFARWRNLFLRAVAAVAIVTLFVYSISSIWLRVELQL